MKGVKSSHSSSPKRIDDIIIAALECFTEKGVNETSITDICKYSGASIGSIYHHFKSKDQLAAAVYLRGIESYQKGIIEILTSEKNPSRCISSIVRYHLKWIEENNKWAQYLFRRREHSVISESEDKLAALNKNFAEFISMWLKKNIISGLIRPVPLDIFIPLLFGPCQEYSKLFLAGKCSTKPAAAAAEISRGVWSSISAV